MTKEEKSAYNRAYRLSRLEELRERDRARYHADLEASRERVREQARKRRARDRDAVNQYKRDLAARQKEQDPDAYREKVDRQNQRRREARAADPAGARATDRRKYRKQVERNPHVRRAQVHRRIARKKRAPGRGITEKQWREIEAAAMHVCPYCSMPVVDLDLDHIVPLSAGGAHDVDNAVACCRSCNRSKGDTPLLVWLARRAA